jgi:hypothetical protein
MQLSFAKTRLNKSRSNKTCSKSITIFRRLILLSLIILNIVVQISPSANAFYSPQQPPPALNIPNQDNATSKKYYYGKDFQKFINPIQIQKKDLGFNPEPTPNAEPSALRLAIKSILQKWHRIQPNDYDVIDSSCNGQGCYKHTSIGYDGARKFLLGKFYLIKKENGYAVRDVYCSKEYTSDEFKSQKPGPDIIPDSTVVNVEHTWPQSKFSTNYPPDVQKADLHHLYPSDTKINSIRGNNPFGEVSQDQEKLKCDVSRFGLPANGRNQVFEPPEEHKGHVARALFYFAVKYDKMIDSAQEETLRKWNKDHPVDESEILRNDVIYRIQGSRNPFVDYPELIDQISDF